MVNILAWDENVLLNKYTTPQVERKIYKLLIKFKDLLEGKVRTRLTSHHSNVPYTYGLPKIHNEDVLSADCQF